MFFLRLGLQIVTVFTLRSNVIKLSNPTLSEKYIFSKLTSNNQNPHLLQRFRFPRSQRARANQKVTNFHVSVFDYPCEINDKALNFIVWAVWLLRRSQYMHHAALREPIKEKKKKTNLLYPRFMVMEKKKMTVLKAKRQDMKACFTCPICNNLYDRATTISECLHTCESLCFLIEFVLPITLSLLLCQYLFHSNMTLRRYQHILVQLLHLLCVAWKKL